MNKIRCFLSLLFIGCFSILLNAQQTETDEGRTMDFDFSCEKIEIHPSVNDFGSSPFAQVLHAGKILISTEHDDVYHTDYQTEDAKVSIVVDVPLGKVGEQVYFRIVNQDGEEIDPDDLSPYDFENDPLGCENDIKDTNIDDNRDLIVDKGSLSANIAMIVESQDGSFGVASVELTITDQYAGDNYQVQASLDENFASGVETTVVLTAWKRMYLEMDRMYTKGATVRLPTTLNFNSGNLSDRELRIDNNTDFTNLANGQTIYIFSPDGTLNLECEFETINTSSSSTNLRVKGAAGSYAIGIDYGIRIDGQDETYSLDMPFSGPDSDILNYTSSVQQAFGIQSNGMDGGAFVEFVKAPSGNQNIPKVTTFFDLEYFVLFSESWRFTDNKKNRVQVITGRELRLVNPDGSTEFPRGTFSNVDLIDPNFTTFINIIGVFEASFDSETKDLDAAKMETLSHEIGHKFGILGNSFPHIHDNSSSPNPLYESHDCRDRGVMTYNRNFDDGGIAEFYIECLNLIRDQNDPIE